MAAMLDFSKIIFLEHSPCRDENSHQISIRSLKEFKSYIDLNILLKSKMAAMAAILNFCKNKKMCNMALAG
jgi:hypothetical protein